jgi:hypothetical protein
MFHKKILFSALMVLALVLTISCSPRFNWREFRFSDDELTFMFPCKPQEVTKDMEMGDQKQAMTMAACNVGEFNFTIAKFKTPRGMAPKEAIELWQKASWYSVNGSEPSGVLESKTVDIKVNKQQVLAKELSYDKNLSVHWQWFEGGPWIYQLGVYAKKGKKSETLDSQAYDLFFSNTH